MEYDYYNSAGSDYMHHSRLPPDKDSRLDEQEDSELHYQEVFTALQRQPSERVTEAKM